MPVDTAARTRPMHVSEFEINCNCYDNHPARTRAGIAQARACNVSWGSHGKSLARQNREEAVAFAENLRPLLVELGANNVRDATAIARVLSARILPTPRGGRWYPTSVRRLLERLGPTLKSEIDRRRTADAPKLMAESLPPDHPVLREAIARRNALLKEAAK